MPKAYLTEDSGGIMTNRLDFTVPVVITVKGAEDTPQTCHVVSFTDKNLIIESTQDITPNSKVYLHLLRDLIPFLVKNSEQSEDNNQYFQWQLESTRDDVNLSNVFSSFSKFAS